MLRPLEVLLLELLLPQAKTRTLPVEDLDLVALFVREHEQLTGKRIAGQLVFDQDGKTVDALAKVDRVARQPNGVEIVRRPHHERDPSLAGTAIAAPIKRPSASGETPAGTSIVMPLASEMRALGLDVVSGAHDAENEIGANALPPVDDDAPDSNPRFFNCPFQQ